MAQARVRDVKPLRYVARQPIFDREEKVFGYELLFRDGLENAFHGDTDEASRATLDRTLLMGLDVLCDGRRAFVNCTRDTLDQGTGHASPVDYERWWRFWRQFREIRTWWQPARACGKQVT